MLKNGQTYFKTFAMLTRQKFQSIFGHFLTLLMKGLNKLAGLHFLANDSPEFLVVGPMYCFIEILFY